MTCGEEKPHLAFLRNDSVCIFLVVFNLEEMEFSNWLCLPTQEFSPQVPPLLTGLCAVAK